MCSFYVFSSSALAPVNVLVVMSFLAVYPCTLMLCQDELMLYILCFSPKLGHIWHSFWDISYGGVNITENTNFPFAECSATSHPQPAIHTRVYGQRI